MVQTIFAFLALMNQISTQFNPAIIIMAKVPQIGTVKTRLRPILSAEQCAEIATCFLQDTIANASQVFQNIIVAYSPAELKTEIETLIPSKITLIEQTGNDLGERMFFAFQGAENMAFSPIITIGTDSPTLPIQVLQNSIDAFRDPENDLVLGSTEDGGYYLVGLRKSNKEIFTGISWSSEKVLTQTIEKAKSIGIRHLTKLKGWYDVDLPDDLIRLRNEILSDESLQKRLVNTAKWFSENDKLFG
jgi:uncharacterized protein